MKKLSDIKNIQGVEVLTRKGKTGISGGDSCTDGGGHWVETHTEFAYFRQWKCILIGPSNQ